MKRSFAADPTSLREVRKFIRKRADEAALYRREVDDWVLAVSEVCANAVLHAGSDRFVVSWKAGPREDTEVTEVNVRDRGVFGAQGMGNDATLRGYGLPLVASLVDEVSITRGTPTRPGTTVRLIKYRDS
jgi:anti-sigma regulatory factor (Ser/Thr protein kinase)